jgi:hypothetical protein
MMLGHGDGSLNGVTVFWPGVASVPANVSIVPVVETVVQDGRRGRRKRRKSRKPKNLGA